MDGDRIATATEASAHQEQTRRLVRAMMALTGESASGLARAAGLTPSTLNRFMHKAVRHTLSQRTMLALMTETFRRIKDHPRHALDPAALAELGPAIAVYEQGMIEAAPALKAIIDDAKTGAGESRARHGAAAPVPELPVLLASTQNVHARDGVFAQAPLKTQRPPFLDNDPRAFALLMPDTSMHPRFDAGDMLYVSPARDLGGDHVDVVVERPNGGFIVGGLAGLTPEAVKLALLTPRGRQSFARDKIRGVYRIVGVQRLGN